MYIVASNITLQYFSAYKILEEDKENNKMEITDKH